MLSTKSRASLAIALFMAGSLPGMGAPHLPVAANGEKPSTRNIVRTVYRKGLEKADLDKYPGILMLHGISEFAAQENDPGLLQETIGTFERFGTGGIAPKGNFISYESGGSGAAYLSWLGAAPSLDRQVKDCASRFLAHQKRTPEGLMTSKHAKDGTDQIFIDVAFAVSPFLLYSGLKEGNPEYVDFAVFEVLEIFRILEDRQTGLLHQARSFTGPGILSEDNWSRGNGWGAFALAPLVRDLPESHPRRPEIVALAQRFFTAALALQNADGLWHQEMTDPTSYVETSGSGLLLYGIGIMLEKGLLDDKYRDRFVLGLQGLLPYIGSDGSVSHTCSGCLNPGRGTKQDYKDRAWIYNDHHAFGPVVLAFAQAARMGISEVAPNRRPGLYTIADSPQAPRAYMVHARGSDIAWENDRIAFRVFGPSVRDKIGSGVDVWAKKVDHPVLDKWYRLNAEGKDYHTDRGEGADFYDMGRLRGCGAPAIWVDGVPYPAQTFDSFKEVKNQDDGIAFELHYRTWDVPGLAVTEKRLIELGMGTNLYKVTSTLEADRDIELTVAIGITTFGGAETVKDRASASLSAWERMDAANGSLGTAVLADPRHFAGFATHGGDEFILVRVKANVPFTYYAGAGWEKSAHFPERKDWERYVKAESAKVEF